MLESITRIDEQVNSFFQSLQNPFFDFIFHYISFLGTTEFFILLLLTFFIIFERKDFYVYLFSAGISMIFNTVIKEIVKRPRPYTLDNVTVPDIIYTSGYSFPSGHNQNVASIGTVFIYNKNKIMKIIFIILMVLMPLSRMYLAQHYLSDCLVGLFLGLVFTYIGIKLFEKIKDKLVPVVYILSILSLIALFVFPNSLVCTFAPLLLMLGIGRFIETHLVNINNNTNIKYYMVKSLIIGLLPVIIIYVIFSFFTQTLILTTILYLLIGGYVFLGFPIIRSLCK